MSGLNSDSSYNNLAVFIVKKGNDIVHQYVDAGNGITVDLTDKNYDKTSCFIRVYPNQTLNNVTFKPQLEFGTQATSFEKGFETTCSIQLDEPLGYGEYVDVINKKLYKVNSVQDVSITGELIAADSEANNIVCNTMYAPSKIEVEYWQDIKKVIRDLQNAILSLGGNI